MVALLLWNQSWRSPFCLPRIKGLSPVGFGLLHSFTRLPLCEVRWSENYAGRVDLWRFGMWLNVVWRLPNLDAPLAARIPRPSSKKLDGSGTLTKAKPDNPSFTPNGPIVVNCPAV